MPSIALFIKQLLSEDKYSSDFSDKISERINELNAAQLQGIYNHLVATAKTSKSETWGWANRELVRKIEGVLKERVAEAEKIDKILEENRLKSMQKHRKIKEAKIEQKRVMRMIAENARKTAEAAVREEEQKRAADEKGETMIKVYKAEERRDEWWKRTAVFFVIGVVVVSATVKDIFILLPCLFVVFLITAVLVYRAQQFTVIVPRVVDETELEMEIERRGDVLQKKAISALREKERKFQEQQARDEEERKARKALKKQQARFEAQLMIARRQQQLAQANEILTRRTTTAGTDTSSRRAASAGGPPDSMGDNGPPSIRDKGFFQSASMGSLSSHTDYQHVPMPTIVDLEGVDAMEAQPVGREELSASFPDEPHTDEYSSQDEKEHALGMELYDLDSSEDEALTRMGAPPTRSSRKALDAKEDVTATIHTDDEQDGENEDTHDDKECIQEDERMDEAAQVLLELTQHNESAQSRRGSSAKSTAVASARVLPRVSPRVSPRVNATAAVQPSVAEPKVQELSLEDLEEGHARQLS